MPIPIFRTEDPHMAIGESIKKIFKKDGEVKQDTPQAVEATTKAAESAQKTERPKHGENGVCCGGCS